MLMNIHLGPPFGGPGEPRRRYDTLMTPNGTIATLLYIEEALGFTDIIGIDEVFPGASAAQKKIRSLIENDIAERRHSFLLFTVLLYNAERVVKLIRELKREYGKKITTVVGGQLIPLAEAAYVNNPDVDVVCVGDAEIILPEMLRNIDTRVAARPRLRPRYEGWVKDTASKKFAGVSYRHFWLIHERLVLQRTFSAEFGEKNQWSHPGLTQLTIQGPGGPGCAWAAGNKEGACSFCALQNITQMSENSIRDTLENEAKMAEEFGADRFFDIANLFLPSLRRREMVRWLSQYAAIRSELGLKTSKYGYLTISSINDEIAGMLREIGFNEAYLGLDHFHPDALAEQNKSFRTKIQHEVKNDDMLVRALDALKANGIAFRASIVVGAAHENEQTLEAVRRGVRGLFDRYDNVRSIRISPVKLLPGARIFAETEAAGVCSDIFERFRENGYLTAEQQGELNRTYMEEVSGVPYSVVDAMENEVIQMSAEYGKANFAIPDERLSLYEAAVGA